MDGKIISGKGQLSNRNPSPDFLKLFDFLWIAFLVDLSGPLIGEMTGSGLLASQSTSSNPDTKS